MQHLIRRHASALAIQSATRVEVEQAVASSSRQIAWYSSSGEVNGSHDVWSIAQYGETTCVRIAHF